MLFKWITNGRLITQPCGIPINIPVYNDWINNIDIALREYIITEEDLKKDVNVLKLFTSEYYDGRQCPCKFVISAGKQLYKTITNKEWIKKWVNNTNYWLLKNK